MCATALILRLPWGNTYRCKRTTKANEAARTGGHVLPILRFHAGRHQRWDKIEFFFPEVHFLEGTNNSKSSYEPERDGTPEHACPAFAFHTQLLNLMPGRHEAQVDHFPQMDFGAGGTWGWCSPGAKTTKLENASNWPSANTFS
jgi:hypothetical protein